MTKTLNQLTEATTLDDTDLLLARDSTAVEDKKITLANLKETAGINQNAADINDRVIRVGSVAEGFSALTPSSDFRYDAASWSSSDGVYSPSRYIYRSDLSKSLHNGVLFVSPTVPSVGESGQTESGFISGAGETDTSGSGVFMLISGSVGRETSILYGSVFNNLQEHIDYLSRLNIVNKVSVDIAEGSYSGTEWDTGVSLIGVNLSNVEISGQGAGASITTNLTSSFSVSTFRGSLKPFIYLKDSSLGNATGIEVFSTDIAATLAVYCDNSSFKSNSKYQFTGTNSWGILAENNSKLDVKGCDVSNCGNRADFDPGGPLEGQNPEDFGSGSGLECRSGSSAEAEGITADYCGKYGVAAVGAGSSINAQNGSMQDCGHHNFLAGTGASGNVRGSNLDDCLNDNLVAISASNIDAEGASANRGAVFCVIATVGSKISFAGGSAVDGSQDNVFCNRGSEIDCTDATLTGAGRFGVSAQNGGHITARGANVSGSADKGFFATGASTIEAQDSIAQNCTGRAYESTRGSHVNAYSGDATGSGDGYGVFNGSIMNATLATGGTLNITANTVTSDGIIFQ